MVIDQKIAFGITDWNSVEAERHEGATGFALWRVQHVGNVRVRMVEYSANYLADHWCKKGHIILCVKGEMITELEDGREFILTAGLSYQVGDGAEAHRTRSEKGVTLFIVD